MIRKSFGIFAGLAALVAFCVVLYRTAWLNDDAYITYRVVENFVEGYGLRWNVDERVQAFTNPLWLFLNAVVFFFTRETFVTFLAVAMSVSVAAVGTLIFGVARTAMAAVVATVILLSSRAFVDYSTSGLENPMTHLLLALFLVLYFRRQWGSWSYFGLALITGLAVLNRMDTLLLFAPALAYAFFTMERKGRGILLFAAGLLPFVAWEVFSVIYYGFPFPNTAYAKLGTGIADSEMAAQGLNYYLHTLVRDPVTLPVILIGLASPFFVRQRNAWPFALGMALYLLYIVKIGGDFMGGRFFAAPLFLAACLIARVPMRAANPLWSAAIVVTLIASLWQPHAPFTTGADFTRNSRPEYPEQGSPWNPLDGWQDYVSWKDENGIGDERRFWFQNANLINWKPGVDMPQHSYVATGKGYREQGETGPVQHGSVGFRGFFGGPTVHIVDYYALTEPLLARMPARYTPSWRIGHFTREMPRGYMAYLKGNPEALQDENLRKYREKLTLITEGNLFTRERFETILSMNAGVFDAYIDADAYRFPDMQTVTLPQVAVKKRPGTSWRDDGNVIIPAGGVEVQIKKTVHNSLVDATLSGNDQFKLMYMRNGEMVADAVVEGTDSREDDLRKYELVTPIEAIRAGYDTVRIIPFKGDKRFALGHFTLE